MKGFLLLVMLPFFCFGQRNKIEETSIPTVGQYGYVNGVRIDTIDVLYAQVGITVGMQMLAGNNLKKFDFEYGQRWKSEKEVRLTDHDGKTFLFSNTAEALNFFEFNGWSFVMINLNPYQILLRKKSK